MQLGQSLVKIRKDNNLTQEQFAQKFNVTRQTVSNWENEKSYPDLLTLVKISDEFDYSLDKMLKENPNMTADMSKKMKLGDTMLKVYKQRLIVAIVGTICSLGLLIYCLAIRSGVYAALWAICLVINISSIIEYINVNKRGKDGLFEALTEENLKEIRNLKAQGDIAKATSLVQKKTGKGIMECKLFVEELKDEN